MTNVCEHCGEQFATTRSKRRFCSQLCANRANGPTAAKTRESDAPWTSVWSCGGGVDSTAIACMIVEGEIEKPDYGIMVDCGYERRSTWEYVSTVIIPRVATVGLELRILRTADYGGDTSLINKQGCVTIPAHRKNPDGSVSKLRTWCNGNWKVKVVMRWARSIGIERMENWVGMAADEQRRVKPSPRKWRVNRYPLVEAGLTRADCLYKLGTAGWPKPPRTSCFFCPNQADGGWLQMFRSEPDEFEKACKVEAMIQETHPDVFLHRKCLPLRTIPGV